MGIKGDATKMAQCIGTPTGLHTAVCRRAWKQSIPRKNRADLTHHLWDAITVSFIPPAKGLNTIEYGGIFYHVTEASAAVTEMTALPVCPELASLDKDTDECLVERPRQSSSKKQRFDKSIYGRKADGTLRIRKPIKKGEGIASDEHSLWEALKASGVPDEKIPPPKVLRSWLDSDATGPLRLKDGTSVGSLPIKAGKPGTVMAQVAHRNHVGQSMGIKVAGEANWRLEVWKTQDGNTVKYHTRVIPHPRALKIFKAANGVAAWRKKDQATGKTWRQQVTGSLPPYAKKVGHFEKGMVLQVPLTKQGEVATDDACYKCVSYRVASIESKGRVELKMSGVKQPAENSKWAYTDLPSSSFVIRVSAPVKLASLLKIR